MALRCGHPEMSSMMMSSNNPPDRLEREHSSGHSIFGDGYSIKSRSTGSTSQFATLSRYHDEPEADYDEGATELYRLIESKDWDGALSRLEMEPMDAKTWVSRREHLPGPSNGRPTHSNKTRWRLLPIHAVCIFRAPLALIEALIEVYPDGAQMKDDQGMLPVHLACRNGASKGVVLTLLQAFPASIYVADRKGRTPMDLVHASASANKENVLVAMSRFQQDMAHHIQHQQQQLAAAAQAQANAALVRDNPVFILPTSSSFGGAHHAPTPAHSEHHKGSENQPQPSLMKKTEPATPASISTASSLIRSKSIAPPQQQPIKEVDYENRTTLFRHLLKKDWTAAGTRAVTHSEEAATWIVTKGFNGNLRFLPLHKACVLQPPDSLVEALLTAYEEAATCADQDGWLPLHCACFYGASEKVVGTLLKAYGKATQCKDDDGRLPLHYACLKGASQQVVDALLATYSKAASAKDDEGRLPIHHACSKGAPEGIIDALIKASPKAAQTKDDQGRLPLHHACRKTASERVIRSLLRVYPRAAQIKDDQDKLPLHYACQHAASTSVITLLLATYPEAVCVANGFGYTPLAEAKALENPNMAAAIKAMEKAKKEQEKKLAKIGDSNEAEVKVVVMQDKITHLEKTLSRVGSIGKAMRSELKKNKNPADVLDKFAQDLIDLGVRAKTPLKSRQSTPMKGLFGRGKNKTRPASHGEAATSGSKSVLQSS